MKTEVPHILLVVEDETLAEITAFRLELLGYSVKTVNSGEAALPAVVDRPPDLMIVDLKLPNMSGLELIERVSNSNQGEDEVWIMALSIEADLDAVQQAYNVGAKDYLVAPFDPLTLESKVEQVFQKVGRTV